MGLYFQRHQKVPSESKFRTPGQVRSHNDRALYGRICETPHQNVSQTRRARNGKDG